MVSRLGLNDWDEGVFPPYFLEIHGWIEKKDPVGGMGSGEAARVILAI